MSSVIQAVESGAKIGQQFGESFGEALFGAEDRKLAREAKRAEVAKSQAQAELAQVQTAAGNAELAERIRQLEEAARIRDIRDFEATANNAKANNFQSPQLNALLTDKFNALVNQYPEMQGLQISNDISVLNDDMVNGAARMSILTGRNYSENPSIDITDEELTAARNSVIALHNTNDGSVVPISYDNLLPLMFGNLGISWQIAEANRTRQQEIRKANLEALEKTTNIENKQANTAHTLQKMEDEAGDRRRMQQRSNEYQQRYDENPAAVSSLKSNDKGYYSGINYHKPGEGDTSAVTPQAAVDLKTQWQGKFTDALELAKQGKLSVDQLKNVLAGEKSKIGKDKSLLSDYTEAQVNFTRQLRFEAIQNPDLSPEIKAQMLKIADEMDRTLYREDDEYNVSGDKDSVYNMAVSSQIIDAVSRGDAQGILKNLFGIMNTLGREVQDWSNLTSDNFEKQIGIANAFKSTQPQLLAALFQGRMTNKLYSELATSSLWRSEATNLSTLRNNLYTLANLIKDKKVRPSLESKRDAQVMMLEDAIFNLDKLTTGQAQISSGTAYVAKSPEDAITNSKYTTAIYFNNTKKTADIYYPGDRTKENPRVVSIPILEFKKEYGVGAVGKFFGNFGIGNGNPYGSKFREMGVE